MAYTRNGNDKSDNNRILMEGIILIEEIKVMDMTITFTHL